MFCLMSVRHGRCGLRSGVWSLRGGLRGRIGLVVKSDDRSERLPCIPEADFSNDKSFSYGIFTYRGKVGSDKFIVVQYYTEATH